MVFSRFFSGQNILGSNTQVIGNLTWVTVTGSIENSMSPTITSKQALALSRFFCKIEVTSTRNEVVGMLDLGWYIEKEKIVITSKTKARGPYLMNFPTYHFQQVINTPTQSPLHKLGYMPSDASKSAISV